MSIPIKDYAQNLKYIHISEIWWVATHPFVAKKSFKISEDAKNIANQHLIDPQLDGDNNGGMVDAFRHCLWMSMLVQHIKPEAAVKLGKAHEKGNYKDFKKKKLEDGSLPDSVSCEMDLRNNLVGIELGQEYMGTDVETLSQLVKNAIIKGRCWKIKKDTLGRFLDNSNQLIPDKEWKGKWINPKQLVPSNY